MNFSGSQLWEAFKNNVFGRLKRSKTGSDALIYLGSKMLTKVITFGLLPVWTLLLTPEEYGALGIMTAWAGILSPLLLCGLPSSIIRSYNDFEDDASGWEVYVGTITLFITILGVVTFAFLGVVEPLWKWLGPGELPFYPLVPITISLVVVGSYSRIALACFNASRRSVSAVILEQSLTTGTIAGALVMVGIFGMGVTGYLLGGLLNSCLIALALLVLATYRRWKLHWNTGYLRAALLYGIPLVPQAMAAWMLSLSDRIILEHFWGLSEAGYYNLAANVGMVMSFVAVSLSQAVTPRYFEIKRQSKGASCLGERQVEKLNVGSLLVLSLCATGMLAFASPVLYWLADERFAQATRYVNPVILGFLFFGIYQMFLRPLLLQKRTGVVAWLTLGAAVLNVSLNLLFIPKYGAMAAAMTTVVSYIVVAIATWWLASKHDAMGIRTTVLFYLVAIPIAVALCGQFLALDSVQGILTRFFVTGLAVAAIGLGGYKTMMKN